MVQVTVWLDAAAVAEVAFGHALAPDGRFDVEMLAVCQLAAVVETVNPVGKVTDHVLTSVDVVAGVKQTIPVVAVLVFMRSKRTMDCPTAAKALCATSGDITVLKTNATSTTRRIFPVIFIFIRDEFVMFFFFYLW